MKSRNLLWLAAVAAVVTAGVLSLAWQWGRSGADADGVVVVQTGSSVSASVPAAYLFDCAQQPVQAPAFFTVTCGDANSALEDVSWVSWGGVAATATGRYVENTCEPYCAAGRMVEYPVSISAGGLAQRGSARAYTTITLTFPEGRPEWLHGRTTHFDVSIDAR